MLIVGFRYSWNLFAIHFVLIFIGFFLAISGLHSLPCCEARQLFIEKN
jgi:heme/copper-type cytochrome/quinol oxidase subunit 1